MCETEEYTPASDTGTLRFSITAVERGCLLAPLFKKARKLAPSLTIEARPSGSPDQMVDKLRQGSTDFALMAAQIAESDDTMAIPRF